jgi:hypothetical protein
MFKEIGIAVRALFSAMTVLFGAFAKMAGAVDHLASWSEETAGAFSDEARAERLAKQADTAKAAVVATKAIAKAKATKKPAVTA